MRIGIAFDLVPEVGAADGPDDRYEEFDKPETIQALADIFRGEGHEVVLLGDGREFLIRVLDDPPDFVFNIAEGQGVGRSREARVPAVLEMLGIPYSGSDPLTLAAALDKAVARRLVSTWGVQVPLGVVVNTEWQRALVSDLGIITSGAAGEAASPWYPVILKPAFEGSSKGIRGRCLAESAEDAAEVCRGLLEEYHQPIIVEQFIDGDEVTVGVLGNGTSNFEILGAMRIVPREPTDHFIYSLEVKRDWERRVTYESPAQLSDEVRDKLYVAARNAYRALGCRDVSRIDFRIKNGVPFFIEANPLPGLSPVTSDLMILARGHGISYEDLIRRILNTALARVGLARSESEKP